MEEIVKVLRKNPGERAEWVEIDQGGYDCGSIRMQEIVGGYLQAVAMGEGLILLCNEDGKRLNLKPHLFMPGDTVVGNVLVVTHDDEGELVTLTEAQFNRAAAILEEWSR